MTAIDKLIVVNTRVQIYNALASFIKASIFQKTVQFV